MAFALCAALTIVGLAALLFAEHRGSRRLVTIAKPAASTGFVLAAIAAGALETPYGLIILGALVFSWLGDVLLIPDDPGIFQYGIASFLLAHVAYLGAFVARGFEAVWIAVALAVLAPVVVVVLRWLQPHVPAAMWNEVQLYVAAITLMVAAAAGAVGRGGPPAILVGAAAFYLSDLSVARDRFVAKAFVNRAWGLPLYYAAQLVLASTV